ncbi:flavin reductase [Acidisoma sp. C75]
MPAAAVLDRARLFRNALGSFATGVTIVTTRSAEGADIGMTANSFNSVSLDPPMVLWSLAKTSSCFAAFMEAERFAVHILSVEQEGLSGRFARPGNDRFAGLVLERGEGGVPLLTGCAARFQCRITHRHEGGDHIILVGAVDHFDHDGHPPLAFHGGRYGTFIHNEPQGATTAGGEGSIALLSELLVRAEDALLRQVEARLGEEDGPGSVTLGEYEILRSLIDLPLTLEQLEDWAGPAPETATLLLVEGLAERGLVQAPKEGGAIALTEAGHAAIEAATQEIGRIEDRALGSFTREERRLLRRFLERIGAGDEQG